MRYLLFSLASLLVLAMPLRAQRREDALVGVRHIDRAEPAAFHAQVASPSVEPTTPRWPFIVGGAVVGGVAAAAIVAHSVSTTDDGMVLPVVHIGVVLAGGALVGAAVGWLVSELVR